MTDKGKVLFVSYHFPPSVSPGSLRVTTITRRLKEKGWKISVVSAKHSEARESDPTSVDQIPENVRVVRTTSFELHRKIQQAISYRATTEKNNGFPQKAGLPESFKRALKFPFSTAYKLVCWPDKQMGWVCPLIARLLGVIREESPDVVFSSSPPHSTQLAVLAVRKMRKFNWIVDFRDPWTAPSRRRKSRLSAYLQYKMEKAILLGCDRIIANTPGNKAALEKAFPEVPPSKISVVTNGFDTRQKIDDAPLPPDALDCDLMYVGEVYPDMLDLLIGALCIIKERHSEDMPRIHVFGNIDDGEYLKIAEHGLEKYILRRGFVSWGQSLRLMKGANSLLLLLPHHERWTTCVPSKLYPYLSAGKPVLAILPPGDAASIIEETGVGLSLTTNDTEEIADSLRRFVVDVSDSSSTFARDPQAIEKYSMDELSDRIDEIMTDLVPG